MAPLTDIAKTGRKAASHRPWPRAIVGSDGWRRAIQELVEARATLLGLWGDKDAVHLALLEEPSAAIAVFTLECPDGKFPSVGAHHPAAIRLERTIADLYGFKPTGAADTRHWLDLGFWGVTQTRSARRASARSKPTLTTSCPWKERICTRSRSAPSMPASSSQDISASPPTARRWFASSSGSAMCIRAPTSLMIGATLDKGAKLASRTSGDSTVAYALAFAQAVESALQINVPERAVWLRALMAEIERLANHFGDIGAICNDASFSLIYAECGILRERTLARGGGLFRPQADDGPHRAWRRH